MEVDSALSLCVACLFLSVYGRIRTIPIRSPEMVDSKKRVLGREREFSLSIHYFEALSLAP